jgi:hypothetical protein
VFLKDLDDGKFAEGRVLAVLERGGLCPARNAAKSRAGLSSHDLSFRLDDSEFFAEVKFDRMAASTGNIALEYWNCRSDQESGLLATRSHLWVHVLPSPLCVYAAGTGGLRKFVGETPPLRRVERAGDGNANLLLYRARDILPPIFVGLDVTTPDELPAVIRFLVESSR